MHKLQSGICHLFRVGDLRTIMQRPEGCNWPIEPHMEGFGWKLEGQCQQAEQLVGKLHHGCLVDFHCCSEARHKILHLSDAMINIIVQLPSWFNTETRHDDDRGLMAFLAAHELQSLIHLPAVQCPLVVRATGYVLLSRSIDVSSVLTASRHRNGQLTDGPLFHDGTVRYNTRTASHWQNHLGFRHTWRSGVDCAHERGVAAELADTHERLAK